MRMSSTTRVACLTTHPIQYHAQWFRGLAEHPQIDLDVLYCHQATPGEQAKAGFGVEFDWDIPLLDGYRYRFLKNVSRNPSAGSFLGLDTPEVETLVSRERYDVVLVNGWHYKSAWQVFRACWRNKIPVMVRSDSHLGTKRNILKTLLKEAPYRWLISKFDACLAVGRSSKEYFLHYGAQPDRIFLVPHAVPSSPVIPERAAHRSRFRDQWGVPRDATVFVFSGKFIDKKRPLDFVRAIEMAGRRCPNIAGLMVGDGPLREQCQSLAREKNLPIQFTGFLNQSKIPEAYTASDALVLPSDGGETWGLVVNEAMSLGIPCIVSDEVGCVPDLVLPGQTGFVFQMGNVQALSSCLVNAVTDSQRLVSMGATALRRIESYSTSVAVDGVLQALSRVRRVQ
jgi:glycosyltransferase involved in cell wall biosynthesis